jgi:surface polysaccharide O-acyltransferase-like enzyme
MALMLSPTMFSSWHRTLIFLYFAFLGDSFILMKLCKGKKQKYLIRAVLIAGVIVNLILTVGLQIRKAG